METTCSMESVKHNIKEECLNNMPKRTQEAYKAFQELKEILSMDQNSDDDDAQCVHPFEVPIEWGKNFWK